MNPAEAYGPLNEIERHIDLAHSFAAGFSYEAFQTDRRTVYAVLCCLEIIIAGGVAPAPGYRIKARAIRTSPGRTSAPRATSGTSATMCWPKLSGACWRMI